MPRFASLVLIPLASVCVLSLRAERGRSAQHQDVVAGLPRTVATLSEEEIRDRDIEFFAARAARDPEGAMDLAKLGALYLERGRTSGDPHDAILAEEAARTSLAHRASRNVAALQVLQSSLLAQHRFTEALPLARAAYAAEPEAPSLRAAVGEIEMELGEYDSARVVFTGLRYTPGDPAVEPRLARWLELNGKPNAALLLLKRTLRGVLASPLTPADQKAWYWLRVGDVSFRAGNYIAADSAYIAGLKTHPGDHRLLSALSRSALARGNAERAIVMGEKAIAVTLDPATLGTLSTAYRSLGDTARSDEYANALEVSVRNQPGAYHRAWSLFLLDRGLRTEVVMRKIRKELETRNDVYGYDLLAWALHRQGRDRDARIAMQRALALGTRDVMLADHARVIEDASR